MENKNIQTKFSRNCPFCNVVLYYPNLQGLRRAISRNTGGYCCRKSQLSKQDEIEIATLLKTYSQKEIAKKFGVKISPIQRIAIKYKINCNIGRLNTCRKISNIDYFKEIDAPDKAYWLGFICGDGCIHKNWNKVSIQVADKEICEKFKKAIGAESTISVYDKPDKRTGKIYIRYVISVNSIHFKQHLVNLGVTHEKTDKLEMPKMDEKYYSYFFAGLFDADGSVQNSGKLYQKNNRPSQAYRAKISLISTKEILAFLSNFLNKKLGITELKMNSVTKNKNNVWKMYLNKHAGKFLSFIYQDEAFPYLQRKFSAYLLIKEGERQLQKIKSPLS